MIQVTVEKIILWGKPLQHFPLLDEENHVSVGERLIDKFTLSTIWIYFYDCRDTRRQYTYGITARHKYP